MTVRDRQREFCEMGPELWRREDLNVGRQREQGRRGRPLRGEDE